MPKKATATHDPDVAYTPPELVRALLAPAIRPALAPPTSHVWEPCAGDGGFARILRDHVAHVVATEVDPVVALTGGTICADARYWSPPNRSAYPKIPGTRDPSWEIWTNPPFSLSEDLVRTWLGLPDPPTRLVLLLRGGWLLAARRLDLLPHLDRIIHLTPRISFGGPGREDHVGQSDTHHHDILVLRPDRPYSGPGGSKPSWHYDWRNQVLR